MVQLTKLQSPTTRMAFEELKKFLDISSWDDIHLVLEVAGNYWKPVTYLVELRDEISPPEVVIKASVKI